MSVSEWCMKIKLKTLSGLSSNRYSMASTSETYNSGLGTNEAHPLFKQSQSFASMSNFASPSVETRADPASMSQLALPASRGIPLVGRDSSPGSIESGTSAPSQGHLERGPSDDPSAFSHSSAGYSPFAPYSNETFTDEAEQPILPPNFPFTSSHSLLDSGFIQPGQYSSAPVYAELEHGLPPVQPSARTRQPSAPQGRGVSLVDTGPVPVGGQVAPHDPVRRVSRHTRHSSSRNQLVSPVSSSSHSSVLPPGAVSSPSLPVLNQLKNSCQAPAQY